jgi:hypothetical protein
MPSDATAPAKSELPHRNRLRARGWLLAIGASLALWGAIGTAIWAAGAIFR